MGVAEDDQGVRYDLARALTAIGGLDNRNKAIAQYSRIIREYAKLKGLKSDKEEVEARMAQLEDVVHDLDRQVNRLLESEQFRRELETGRQRRSLPEL